MSNLNIYRRRIFDESTLDSDQDLSEEQEIGQEKEEDLDESFAQQVSETIYKILGRKFSNRSKEEIINSMSCIIQKNQHEFLQSYNYQQQNYIQTPRTFPIINIIYVNPAFSFSNGSIPINNIYQSTFSAPQPNPYLYTTISSYQNPPPIPFSSQIPISAPIQNIIHPQFEPNKPSQKADHKKDKKKKDTKKDKKKDKEKKLRKNQKKKFEKKFECNDGIFNCIFNTLSSTRPPSSLVQVSGNSFNSNEEKKLMNIINPNKECKYWASQDVPNSYIKIDFMKSFAKIRKYTLVCGNSQKTCFFTSWTLTGVTCDEKTVILDDVNSTTEIYKDHTEITRDVKCNKKIKSVKISMKGKSSWVDKPLRMILRKIELFGSFVLEEE